MRKILHIDFDSFFASVEQQFNTNLRGKPIGVTATNGRTCIIASSREAKRFGIKTGDRTWESLPKCPNLILVSADFNKYYEVSKKFLKIAKNYSPFVELFSIDEVFIDLTPTEHLFGGWQNVILEIKQKIKQEIGEYITASIGVSHNRLLAKLASGMKKPNGVFKIDSSNMDVIFKKANLTDLCGIGERIAIRLNKMGIYNLFDIRKTSQNDLIGEFGNVEASFLKNLSYGIDESIVLPYTVAPKVKSVGRNYCLPKNTYEKKVVLQNIFELCEEIGIRLRGLKKKGRTVSFFLGGATKVGRHRTIRDYIDKGSEIFRVCKKILDQDSYFFKSKNYYTRQIHISVSSLEDIKNLTPSLFNESYKSDNVTLAIDKINERFGDHTVRNGFLLYSEKLTTMPNGYFADNFERTKLADSFR